MWDPYESFKTIVLDNGLRLHIAVWDRPWEIMAFRIGSGAYKDPQGCEGVAHFVEHLVSANVSWETDEIEKFFDELGGNVNLGVTSYLDTRYSFKAPLENTVITKAISIFGEMLVGAKLVKRIEEERQIIKSEFNRSCPLPIFYTLNLHRSKALYGESRQGKIPWVLGDLDTIQKITPTDIQEFYDNHYFPGNMDVIAIGGMNLADVKENFLRSQFSSLKKGEENSNGIYTYSPPLENRLEFKISEHFSEQKGNNCNYYSSAVIPAELSFVSIQILVDMLSLKLFREVREKRSLAYAINVNTRNYLRLYELNIECAGINAEYLSSIEDIFNNCIDSLASDNELLERCKRTCIAKTLMSDPTASSVCNYALADLSLFSRIITIGEYIDKIQGISIADIAKAVEYLAVKRRYTRIEVP